MNQTLTGQALIRHAADITWTPSPDGAVERKRYRHIGGEESGMVTSLVRYPAGAHFPAHPHPDGEEILVLEGVFSDRSGDYPAGTHLLNPEGFSHAPWSDPGCLLFVKLRQYAGENRPQQQLQTSKLPWEKHPAGHQTLLLQQDRTHAEERLMIHCQAGQAWQPDPGEREVFAVSGEWSLDRDTLQACDWAVLPDSDHTPITCRDTGTLYVLRRLSS